MRRPRARARLVVLALAAGILGGCYEFVPVSTLPAGRPQVLEVLLNERGRADLVTRLGPDVLSFTGTLDRRRDSTLSIRVEQVMYIDRTTVQWSGELMDVTEGQIRDVRGRRFSKGRTFFAVGAAVAASIAFILTRTLTGGGGSTEGGTPPPSPT